MAATPRTHVRYERAVLVTSDEMDRRELLERLQHLDTSSLTRIVNLLAAAPEDSSDGKGYLKHLRAVVESDVLGLIKAEQSYGASWKRRGGVDTFHMLTRKWDRIEGRVAQPADISADARRPCPYDIFEHMVADRRSDGLIDDIRDLRRYLMLIEAETLARKTGHVPDSGRGFLNKLDAIAQRDVETIEEKEKSHGSSWKRRGGIATFMILARKWDRIEQRVAMQIDATQDAPGASRENVFEHIAADRRAEGLPDDIRDLRQFLILVEAEMAARDVVEIGTARDNRERT